MAKSTKPIPEGLQAVTPQIVTRDATRALEFLQKAFGAEMPHPPMKGPDGKIIHGFVKIGGCAIFVAEAGGFSKETAANIFLYVNDVDATFAKAVSAGGKALSPPNDMFWGDRWSLLEDPFGNVWQIATHIEEVSGEEMQKRMQNMPKK